MCLLCIGCPLCGKQQSHGCHMPVVVARAPAPDPAPVVPASGPVQARVRPSLPRRGRQWAVAAYIGAFCLAGWVVAFAQCSNLTMPGLLADTERMSQRQSPSGQFTELTQTLTIDFASQAAAGAADNAVTVAGSLVGDTVSAIPLGTWPAGLSLPQGRCVVAGTVQFRIVNATAGALDPGSQSFVLQTQRA